MLKNCNDSHSIALSDAERQAKFSKIQKSYAEILETLGFDWQNDHNLEESPQRFAKMMLDELLIGTFSPPPKLTMFNNAQRYDQLINSGPWEVKSVCAHHLMPFVGKAYIGLLPNAKTGKIIGLSKYGRVVDWFSRRFQIQEELTSQIAEFLMKELQPSALGVRIVAKHLCVSHRGIEQHSPVMDTIVVKGSMMDNKLKQEFLSFCELNK